MHVGKRAFVIPVAEWEAQLSLATSGFSHHCSLLVGSYPALCSEEGLKVFLFWWVVKWEVLLWPTPS